eukprot:CAMPEP_0119140592 /NCGR_PEP_ID=MMETSP1310-20130426/29490_1 /TAXON_ID=464262 /ORGANISM="Genus nov. species nov., Strain RCC2339" /LENGTH=204 /DNA_ID=CAMNT_0007131955 /DNA_START=86 /DNA_END=697 /DNA_ORIENTATION=+
MSDTDMGKDIDMEQEPVRRGEMTSSEKNSENRVTHPTAKKNILCMIVTTRCLSCVFECIRDRLKPDFNVKVVVTDTVAEAMTKEDKRCLAGIPYYRDSDEWDSWNSLGDEVLHIELRKWVDIMIVWNVDGQFLAKYSAGVCDDLALCVLRAWDPSKRYALLLNMHPMMLNNVTTREVLSNLPKDVLVSKVDASSGRPKTALQGA